MLFGNNKDIIDKWPWKWEEKKILGNFFTLAFAHKTSQIKQFIMPYQ